MIALLVTVAVVVAGVLVIGLMEARREARWYDKLQECERLKAIAERRLKNGDKGTLFKRP